MHDRFERALSLDPVALWTFGGADMLMARGRAPYRLQPGAQSPTHADDAEFGRVARFEMGQYLTLPRAECPALDIHGASAQVSVVAWLKRDRKPATLPDGSTECEAIAGMWNETRRQRQYCLFLNLQIWESAQQVGGHVSAIGGATPGYRYCMDAAIGATPVVFEGWHCVAMTYDGAHCRAYLDGVLDARGERNPYAYPGGIFDGGANGADFTVGAVHRGGEMGNFFVGWMAGLAVYDRALSPDALYTVAAMLEQKLHP